MDKRRVMDDKRMNINLLIDCQPYPLKNIRREDEQLYRDAAKLVNHTLNDYRDSIPGQGLNAYWAMTAVDIAYRYLSTKDRNDTQPYMQKIEELTKELEQYISK